MRTRKQLKRLLKHISERSPKGCNYLKIFKSRIASLGLPVNESELNQHCPKTIRDLDNIFQGCHVVATLIKKRKDRGSWDDIPSKPIVADERSTESKRLLIQNHQTIWRSLEAQMSHQLMNSSSSTPNCIKWPIINGSGSKVYSFSKIY